MNKLNTIYSQIDHRIRDLTVESTSYTADGDSNKYIASISEDLSKTKVVLSDHLSRLYLYKNLFKNNSNGWLEYVSISEEINSSKLQKEYGELQDSLRKLVDSRNTNIYKAIYHLNTTKLS